jgi:hypothetical protein
MRAAYRPLEDVRTDAMRGGAMSAKTETIRVRIAPGVRMWQALLVAAALVGTLLLGLVLGRADASAGAESTFQGRDAAPTVCHVSKRACEPTISGTTGHVPPGGPAAYGG